MHQNNNDNQRCNIKKEIDEKVNAYEKQLESKYMKLIINKRIDKVKMT